MANSQRLAIGIDLGTTYTCAGVYYNDNVKILSNKEGNTTTPSYVAFTDVERLVGDAAKAQFVLNSANTIFDVKRLIGRSPQDSSIEENKATWPFEIVDVKGKIKIKVVYKGVERTFFPEEISSVILTKVKEMSEIFLGVPVVDAVITIPAYFNDSQRQATKDAGTIAGLNVLRIINEPTASALAYGYDENPNGEKKKLLIYDLGGGTFDISILSIDNGIFEILSVGGNAYLGGQDFDNRMIKHLGAEFLRKHKKDLGQNLKSISKLRKACERAKRTLSSTTEATIDIDSLFEGIDFQTKITRMCFEDLNRDLFESTINDVKVALSQSKLTPNDIDEVIVVGGSTRIPIIRKLLIQLFDKKKINEKINADEAVAYGAALQAAILNGQVLSKNYNIQSINDVIPKNLGIETIGANMSVVVERNTPFPCSKKRVFGTSTDYQTIARFSVYQGNDKMTCNNNLLGEFVVTDIPKAKANHESFIVTFEIDDNGIVKVTAELKSTGLKSNITINNNRLRPKELDTIIAENEKFRIEDVKNKDAIAAKNELESFCFRSKLLLNKIKTQNPESDDTEILGEIEDVLVWVNENPMEPSEIYGAKQKEFELKIDPIFKSAIAENQSLFELTDLPD